MRCAAQSPWLQDKLSQPSVQEDPAGSSHSVISSPVWPCSYQKVQEEVPMRTSFLLLCSYNEIMYYLERPKGRASLHGQDLLCYVQHTAEKSIRALSDAAQTWSVQHLKEDKIYSLSTLLFLFCLIKAITLLSHLLSGLSYRAPDRAIHTALLSSHPPTHSGAERLPRAINSSWNSV